MEIKERIIKLENSLKETIKISEEKQIKFNKKKYNYYNENEEFFDETKNIENNSNIEIDNYDTVKLRIEKLLKEKQKLLDKKLEIEKNKKSNIQKDSLDEFFENLNNNNEISIEEQIENLNKKIQQEESLLKFVSPINLKIGTNEKRENFKEEEKNIISKENFDNILTECEKVVCKSHVKKAKFDKQELSSWIYTFGIISFIIFIIFLIILYYSPRYSNGKELSIISIVFALFGSLILIIVLIYNIFKKKIIGKDIEDFVNEDLNKYLDKIKKKFTNGINFTYNQKKKMIIF